MVGVVERMIRKLLFAITVTIGYTPAQEDRKVGGGSNLSGFGLLSEETLDFVPQAQSLFLLDQTVDSNQVVKCRGGDERLFVEIFTAVNFNQDISLWLGHCLLNKDLEREQGEGCVLRHFHVFYRVNTFGYRVQLLSADVNREVLTNTLQQSGLRGVSMKRFRQFAPTVQIDTH